MNKLSIFASFLSSNLFLITVANAAPKQNNTNAKPLILCLSSSGALQAKSKCSKGESIFNLQSLQSSNITAKGDRGDKGDAGSPGVQGAKGDRGLQGIEGLQGIQGAKGDKGDPGVSGLLNLASCYRKEKTETTGFSEFGSGSFGQITLSCNNPETEFVLTYGYHYLSSNSVYLNSVWLNNNNQDQVPNGIYLSTKGLPNSTIDYDLTVDIFCCAR